MKKEAERETASDTCSNGVFARPELPSPSESDTCPSLLELVFDNGLRAAAALREGGGPFRPGGPASMREEAALCCSSYSTEVLRGMLRFEREPEAQA